MSKPIVCIPMGDPSGIGPEIVVKALAKNDLYETSRPVVVGDLKLLKNLNDDVLNCDVKMLEITDPTQASYSEGTINVIPIGAFDSSCLEYGHVQAASGRAAFECITKTVELAMAKKVHAIATTPINKEAIKAAKIDFIGHSEMLAAMTDSEDPLTIYQVRNMRVFFLTRHVSLRKACEMVNKERIVNYGARCLKGLESLGCNRPKLAVAGLNPHNGDHGMFGDEEGREIEPAVAELQAKGLDVVGPIPADSVFALALLGRYDGVLSLYHDQGHIATKTVDFERTISLTVGLPFIRTSVNHGTGFDIAGKGIANETSMFEAIRLAAEYAPIYRL